MHWAKTRTSLWIHLLLCLATSTASTPQISDILTALGPRRAVDFVAILDRSLSVGRHAFYYSSRRLVETLLRYFAPVHPDFVRMSVVTFAKDSTVDYDHIGIRSASAAGDVTDGVGGMRGVTKCELLLDGAWDGVVYVKNMSLEIGTNLSGAFQMTVGILENGRAIRPAVQQVVLVISDGDYHGAEDPSTAKTYLLTNNVTIFTVGIGPFLNAVSMKDLASRVEYYAEIEEWLQMVDNQTLTFTQFIGRLRTAIADDMCNNACQGGSQCYCDIDTSERGCLCKPGYQPSTNHSSSTEAVCLPCPLNSYKQNPGNELCVKCGPGLMTSQTASTSSSDCHCDSNVTGCVTDPCLSNPCPPYHQCTPVDQVNYTCNTGTVDEDPCSSVSCENYGSCFPLADGGFECKCQFGYLGPTCETSIGLCKFDICDNNSTCTDGPGSFTCLCPPGLIGEFCEDRKVTTTVSSSTVEQTQSTVYLTTVTDSKQTTSSAATEAVHHNVSTPALSTTSIASQSDVVHNETTPSSSSSSTAAAVDISPQPTRLSSSTLITATDIKSTLALNASDIQHTENVDRTTRHDDSVPSALGVSSAASSRELIIILVCSIGGAIIVLLIFIVVCALFARRRRRRRAQNATACRLNADRLEANGKFDGLWTQDDSSLDARDVDRSSLSTVIAPSRSSLFGDHNNDNLVSEVTFKNEQITTVGWKNYVDELVQTGWIRRAIVVDCTSKDFSKTDNWKYDVKEIAKLDALMTVGKRRHRLESAGDVTPPGDVMALKVAVQGRHYVVRTNDGRTATGFSVAKTVLVVAKTTADFLVVAVGDVGADEDAGGRCVKEVSGVADKIKVGSR